MVLVESLLKSSGLKEVDCSSYLLKGRGKEKFLEEKGLRREEKRCMVTMIPHQGETSWSWYEMVKTGLVEAFLCPQEEGSWRGILESVGFEIQPVDSQLPELSIKGKSLLVLGNLAFPSLTPLAFTPKKMIEQVAQGKNDLVLTSPYDEPPIYLQARIRKEGLVVSPCPPGLTINEILKNDQRARALFLVFDKII